MDITVKGKPVKAVAEPTKQGMLYVFDRITGKPVWPIPEKAAPKGDVPGEWYAPTQPIPSKPAAYSRTGVGVDDLIDFTPDMRKQALALVKDYKLGPLYTPPVVSKAEGPVATLMMGAANGGTNWPGGSFNPENHTVYVYACNSCLLATALVTPPPGMTDLAFVEGRVGQRVVMVNAAGANQGADAPLAKMAALPAGGGGGRSLTVNGLPLVKPPTPPSAPSTWTAARSSGRSPMARHPIISATVPH